MTPPNALHMGRTAQQGSRQMRFCLCCLQQNQSTATHRTQRSVPLAQCRGLNPPHRTQHSVPFSVSRTGPLELYLKMSQPWTCLLGTLREEMRPQRAVLSNMVSFISISSGFLQENYSRDKRRRNLEGWVFCCGVQGRGASTESDRKLHQGCCPWTPAQLH